MNVTGVIAIKSVRKSQNENGRTVYTGEAVFKDFANMITMPFMLQPTNDKAINFYDTYLMQPGKSGYCSGKLSSSPKGVYLNLDSMEFGSLKLEGTGGNSNGNYQKPQTGYQQTKQPIIETPTTGFNFGSMAQGMGQQQEEMTPSKETVASGSSFWGGLK